jgi:hypothetical protein
VFPTGGWHRAGLLACEHGSKSGTPRETRLNQRQPPIESMKVKSTFLTLSLAALAAGSAWGQADDLPVSRTAGILDISLPAGKTTLLSLPLVEIVASGTVSAVSGSDLTLVSTPAVLPAGLAVATTPHAIKITSRDDQRGTGANAPSGSSTNAYGLSARITAQAGQVVTVSLPAAPNVGDEYVIYRMETLGSAFGADNTVVPFLGAGNASGADSVGIITGGSVVKYFYKTTPLGGPGWKLATDPTGPVQTNVIIPPNAGLLIERRAGTDRALRATGDTLPGNERLNIPSTGFYIVNNPFVAGTTLGGSFLSSFVTGAGTSSGADYVSIEQGGVVTNYWYKNTTLGGTGWRTVVGGTPSDSVALNPGKAILFQERAGTLGFTLPEPFAE